MATDDSPFPDLDGSRDYSRAALALVCLLAVLVAAAALPVLAPEGTQSPVESIVPIPGGPSGGGGTSTSGPGGGSLGALSPGQQTDVGGSLGGQDALTSRSAAVHMVVQSSESAYWRTGAYGTYTGTGWDQDADARPLNGSIETRGMEGTEVTYEVELNRTARSLPTVWRPTTVSREDVLVTDGRAVRVEQPVPAGTTYTGVSDRPPSDPGLLRTAGTDYPSDVEDRYTQLPAGTEDRLGPKAAEITADASNPYDRAVAVESWLESNKEYSLNVSRPPGDDVASEFVHEMDAGYCEYFATSMVAMLRSQDVPARYVVGYSTGQPTGENTYTVRGMNAHAWVEVYFPEVGWVQFDPTPAQERLQQEQQALENQTDESFETPAPDETPSEDGTGPADETETPTPADPTAGASTETPATPTPTGSGDGGESGSAGEGETDEGGTSDGDDADVRRGGTGQYTVDLNRTASPGAAVEVTVTDDGQPVSGVGVLFNGDAVGQTGPDGTVVGEVPYADTLNVTVDDGSGSLPSFGGVPGGADGRHYAVEGPVANTSATFPLSTNATVTVSGDAVTGNAVTVSAFVDDVPVRNASVELDGERVARTDDSGRADVALPAEPGTVTLAVRRGSVAGNTTLTLERLNVTTRPTAPLAVPGTGVAVNATVGGDPAPGANVTVDGRQVATTGVDGTATASLPFASSATLEVTKHGQRRGATYDGLFVNLALVAAGVGVVAGGLGTALRRSGVSAGDGRRWLRIAVQRVVGLVVATGVAVDGALARLGARARQTVTHLRDAVRGRRSVDELLDALRAWLRARADEAREPFEGAVVAPAGTDENGEAVRTDAHTTIRESWDRFLGVVSLRRPRTHTPGEIAAHAVSADGLPADEVRALRDAFRAVEYGQRDPTARAADVAAAVDAIEATADANGAGDGDDASDGGDTGDGSETDPGEGGPAGDAEVAN